MCLCSLHHPFHQPIFTCFMLPANCLELTCQVLWTLLAWCLTIIKILESKFQTHVKKVPRTWQVTSSKWNWYHSNYSIDLKCYSLVGANVDSCGLDNTYNSSYSSFIHFVLVVGFHSKLVLRKCSTSFQCSVRPKDC